MDMEKGQQNHRIIMDAMNFELRNALAPYIARELISQYGESDWWQRGVLDVLLDNRKRLLPAGGSYADLKDELEIQLCLILMDIQWKNIFSKKLSLNHHSWVKELIIIRNACAHPQWKTFTDSYTTRALDTMARLAEQLDEDCAIKLRNKWREKEYGSAEGSIAAEVKENVPAKKKTSSAGIMQKSIGHLKSWREVMRPHPDVAQGRYRQAEFAADLAQVARGEGSTEYLDPIEFFARTYVTDGMRGLLNQALHRLKDGVGEPVIQLKTAFGGGKTHSMLALYHLFHGKLRPEQSQNVREILARAEMDALPQDVRVAVIVGTSLNPAKAKRPPHMPGITINTLWGEIAAQLAYAVGDKKLYDFVKDADRKGVSPGSEALRDLFDACGACLILVDELVAYAKKIYNVNGLPAGSFDNLISFIQELTEAARASKRSMVVASLPESEIEIGGDAGQQVLTQIEHTFGRMESIWKPVVDNESFEVVRRRLFLPCHDEEAREAICAAFSEMYRMNPDEFPVNTKELSYKDDMINCYPIHPEFFSHLYEKWGSIERFQKTRGVLRLMAGVIYYLWINADASCMILPGSIPLDITPIRDELIRYIPENWNAIVDSEVDGKNSEPFQIDQAIPRYGEFMAARRVARTIFLGSAPSVREMGIRGLDENAIRLGVVQPQEQQSIAVFNDALAKLKGQLSYLYSNDTGTRFWYDNRPTLRKLVQDLEQRISADDVEQEIENRLHAWKKGSNFSGLHICPTSSFDVPDEQSVRLVVLPTKDVHERKQKETPAIDSAFDILSNRGNAPRQYKNMLVFLAPDKDMMQKLVKMVKRFKAWQTIKAEAEKRNLDQSQINEANSSIQQVNQELTMRLSQTYCWLFAPYTDRDGDISEVKWDVAEVSCTDGNNIQKAAEKLENEENMIGTWGAALLRMELDNLLWKDKNHIDVKTLWEYLTSYCYLPRLKDLNVLLAAIAKGVASDEFFAMAERVEDGHYQGLVFNQPATGAIPLSNLLVKKEVALKQIAEEREKERERESEIKPGMVADGPETEPSGGTNQPPVKPIPPAMPQKKNRHFSMDVPLDSLRINKDVNTYVSEVLSHLTSLPGAKVNIRLDVDIEVPEGTPPNVVTTVSENCRTLKVENFSFEE